jgi:PAS domain S-box-containing protein
MENVLKGKRDKDFYKVLNQLQIPSILFDNNYDLIFVNTEAATLLGNNNLPDDKAPNFELFSSNIFIREIKRKIKSDKIFSPQRFSIKDDSSNRVFEIVADKIQTDNSSVLLCQILETPIGSSNDSINLFFNNIRNVLLIIDANEFTISEANETALKTYGISKQNIIGSNFLSLSNIPEIEMEHLQQLNYDNKLFSYETVHLKSNGEEIPLKINITKTVYNNTESIMILASEISPDKISENKVPSSGNRFEVLFENNPLITFIIDSDGKILSTNKAVQNELQYSSTELIGKHISEIYHPDDEQLINYQISQCVENKNKPFTWELRLLNRFKNTVWVRVSGLSFVSENGHTELMIVCDNITVQKDTEKTLIDYTKSLQRMLDASPLGVLVYLLDEQNNLRLVTTNQSAENILGIKAENLL